MKFTLRTFAFILAIGATAATARAAGRFADARAQIASDVDGVLTIQQRSAIAPFVDDARKRIATAIGTVATTDTPPRDVLTFSQKRAAYFSLRDGTNPDLGLDDNQRAAIERYARDVARAVAPIVRDDGARIDATLDPNTRARLDAVSVRALATLRDDSAALPIPTPVDALIAAAGDRVGALVLFSQIDLRDLMSMRR